MRIAQVAPLHESVPPRLYGGTERIVSYLTEELVHLGHDVTLFASGDSETAARLVAPCARALRLAHSRDPLARHFAMVETVVERASEFDLVHFHLDYLHFPVTRRERIAHVTTLHSRLDEPDAVALYARFGDMPVVSVSDAQRAPLPNSAWQATVYHGFPSSLYRQGDGRGDYLAFLGRTSRDKGLAAAIEIAVRAGCRLRIAAKLDPDERDYYARAIEPWLRHPLVEFDGEIAEAGKQAFLGGARALLFPIDWPEPFGMVMVEALACGTPVIAFRRGAVPEVIDQGVTGFICDDIDHAVAAIARLPELSRAACRDTFERRFTVERMTREYLAIYSRLRKPWA